MTSESMCAVFPYLRTRERVKIRGIEFRSNKDLEDLPPDAQQAIEMLCSMFLIQDGVQITEMTCAQLDTPDDQAQPHDLLQRLREARLLVGYLYSTPQPGGGVFLASENSSMLVFRPGDLASRPGMVPTALVWRDRYEKSRMTRLDGKEIPKEDMIPGYEVIRDFTSHFWVGDSSRIYPETPFTVLNLSQELSGDLGMLLSRPHNWALASLFESPWRDVPETRERAFTAIDWYLKSCRASIPESEAIVHLAIALESLLKIRSGESLTERFKDAVLTLVGPVPRLDSWLDQFYTARSKAVHEGIPSETVFFAVDRKSSRSRNTQAGPIPHGSLLQYGRHVFHLCLSSVLSGAAHAQAIGLGDMFVHNRERVASICKELSQSAVPPEERLRNIAQTVGGLHEVFSNVLEPHVEVKSVLGAAQLILQGYLDTKPQVSEEAAEAVRQAVSMSSEKDFEKLNTLKECAAKLREERERIGPQESTFLTTVLSFLDYVTGAGFALRCYWEQRSTSDECRTSGPE